MESSNYNKNLYSKLNFWAIKNPNKTFIYDTQSRIHLSYFETKNIVDNIISYLSDKKHTIMFIDENNTLSSILWIAALSGGHSIIPLHSQVSGADLEKLIEYFNPDLFITNRTSDIIDKVKTIIKEDDLLYNLKKSKSIGEIRDEGIVYLTTSGSTGTPKKIALKESQLYNTALNVVKVHESKENDVCLNFLSFSHINAPVIALFSTLISGGTIINSKFSKTNFWKIITDLKVTWVNAVPTIINILLETNHNKKSNIEFIRTGSAPISKNIITKFEKKFDIPIIETYGATESCSQITANNKNLRKIGSVGKPQGLELIICNKDKDILEKLDSNTVGEVCIKGFSVIKKYEDKGFENNFVNGFFKTGDLGYKDKDGFIFLTGRKKDIIISKGENIYPKEIEDTLIKYEGINEVAVIGEKDDILGERVVAFIVLEDKYDFKEEHFNNWIEARLSKYKIPHKLLFVEDFPRLRSYKIDKMKLREYIDDKKTI